VVRTSVFPFSQSSRLAIFTLYLAIFTLYLAIFTIYLAVFTLLILHEAVQSTGWILNVFYA
jgi:hypothetical protein